MNIYDVIRTSDVSRYNLKNFLKWFENKKLREIPPMETTPTYYFGYLDILLIWLPWHIFEMDTNKIYPVIFLYTSNLPNYMTFF